jgi:muramoyltetrapeptide carboxypeptidase
VAPAGPFPEERYARGIEHLVRRGYRVREGAALRRTRRYFSAPDEERVADLQAAFADPEVRAIFTVRGGYGCARLLPALDWRAAAGSGKPLVGFSDVTALHLALVANGGLGIHGPVVLRLAEEPPESTDRLFALLETGTPPAPLTGRCVVDGRATGPLVGGCLSLVSRLVGTPFLPSLDGAVLLLEDVGEKPSALDAMWNQLRLAGHLDRLAGVAVGQLVACEESADAPYSATDVVEDLLRELGKPAIIGVPVGHGNDNRAVLLGARVSIGENELRFVEGFAKVS